MGQDRPFGVTGGPGGVDDQARIVGRAGACRHGFRCRPEEIDLLIGPRGRYLQQLCVGINVTDQRLFIRFDEDQFGIGIPEQIGHLIFFESGIQRYGHGADCLDRKMGHDGDQRFGDEENDPVPFLHAKLQKRVAKLVHVALQLRIA